VHITPIFGHSGTDQCPFNGQYPHLCDRGVFFYPFLVPLGTSGHVSARERFACEMCHVNDGHFLSVNPRRVKMHMAGVEPILACGLKTCGIYCVVCRGWFFGCGTQSLLLGSVGVVCWDTLTKGSNPLRARTKFADHEGPPCCRCNNYFARLKFDKYVFTELIQKENGNLRY